MPLAPFAEELLEMPGELARAPLDALGLLAQAVSELSPRASTPGPPQRFEAAAQLGAEAIEFLAQTGDVGVPLASLVEEFFEMPGDFADPPFEALGFIVQAVALEARRAVGTAAFEARRAVGTAAFEARRAVAGRSLSPLPQGAVDPFEELGLTLQDPLHSFEASLEVTDSLAECFRPIIIAPLLGAGRGRQGQEACCERSS